MFRYVSGKLVYRSFESVIIDVLGIGIGVMIAPNCLDKLPALSSNVLLHTSFVIREFSQTLYGFLQETERELFERLLNVSGIGPKLSLSIIGHLSCEKLQRALFNKDIETLCSVPGIGKKTAERLILELKNVSLSLVDLGASFESKVPLHIQDAVSALINLGYNPTAAERAVSKTLEVAESAHDLPSLITASLRNL